MLLSRAQFTKDDAAQKKFFLRALDSYRLVAPKDVRLLVEAQKNRTRAHQGIPDSCDTAGRPGVILRRLGPGSSKRRVRKLATIESRPDQTPLGEKSRWGKKEIFFHLARYDEARELMRYLKTIVTDDDQGRRRSPTTWAMSLASQNTATKGGEQGKLGKKTEACF